MSAVTFNVIFGGSVIYGIGCVFWLMYALMDWDFAYGDDKRNAARRAFATPVWPGMVLWLGIGFVRELWASAFGPTEEEKRRRERAGRPDPSTDRHQAFYDEDRW